MYVMMVSTHSPESCPIHNQETKKVMQTVMKQVPLLAAKHGVKITGLWANIGTHTFYGVYDTPNMDTFMALIREPDLRGWTSFNCAQLQTVLGQEEMDALLG